MTKDFDAWNKEKKQISTVYKHKFYHPRDIWWCALGVNVGDEQDGTGKDFERPVLVVRGFNKQVCLIVPLSTSQKKNKYYVPIGEVDRKPGTAIISQLRLIDTKRLTNKVGVLEESTFQKINDAIKKLF